MRVTRNGFTLMELGVLLAVVAIGMAYIAPDFMEKARGELAVKTAKEMAAIVDASKWYYMKEGGDPSDRDDMRWPGELLGLGCNPNGAGAAADLRNAGYLRNQDFINPWSQPYAVTLLGGGGDPRQTCRLVVATNVPTSVANEIVTYMPLATCDSVSGGNCPGGAPAGFDRCCAKIVRPGQEMILQDWTAPANLCDNFRGGQVDPSGKCDVRAKWKFSSCYYTGSGTAKCLDGYVAVGTRRLDCGKYCEETRIQCCRGEL